MDQVTLAIDLAIVALFFFPFVALVLQPRAKAAAVRRRQPVVIPVIRYDDDDDDDEDRSADLPKVSLRDVSFDPDALRDEPTACAAFFGLQVAGKSDRGLCRKRNEDALLMMRNESVYVIADGMGGHAGGDVASRLAVDTIAETFLAESFHGKKGGPSRIPPRAAQLVSAIGKANERICETADTEDRLSEMGTTVVAARFCPRKKRVYVSHVGDSRCYRFRDGRLRRITTDHTMAALGMTGRSAAQLSRALGAAPRVEPDVAVLSAKPGDVFLLCSDGLTKMVSEDVIASVVASAEDSQAAVDDLVRIANERGGKDNVTAILVRLMPIAA